MMLMRFRIILRHTNQLPNHSRLHSISFLVPYLRPASCLLVRQETSPKFVFSILSPKTISPICGHYGRTSFANGLSIKPTSRCWLPKSLEYISFTRRDSVWHTTRRPIPEGSKRIYQPSAFLNPTVRRALVQLL